ncbi:MAG: twin-arginine translocation signal domain-containing protein, partial [bacterium]
MSKISRRDFIKKVSIYGAVSGVATAAGMSIVGIKNAKATQAEHPFGYPGEGLDVEVIRQKGYDGYKGIDINGITHAHCAFGA